MSKSVSTNSSLDKKAVVDFDRHLRSEGQTNTVPLLATIFGTTKLVVSKTLEHNRQKVAELKRRAQEEGSKKEQE